VQIKGSNVVITGASRGLGRELRNAFLNEGASVFDWSRSTSGIDVTKPINVVPQKVDLLICNAGVLGALGPVTDMNMEDFHYAFEVNLFGVINSCRAVLHNMIRDRKGKIIIIAGGGATKPMACMSAYAASKTAVVRFAETLAEEVKGFGIDVNCMSPGMMKTGIHDEILASPAMEDTAARREAAASSSYGDFSNAIGLALWLASDKADGVTGRLISAQWDDWWCIQPELLRVQVQKYKLMRQT
jgi:NAD(P)-dependent dehydrogenase (short-subunit alcohol dehydrogenase family)